MRRSRLARVLVPALLALIPTALAGASMKRAEIEISPFPQENRKTRLKGLAYGPEATAKEITAIRFTVLSEEGEDPVQTEWVVTGNNKSADYQRIRLSLMPLDGNGRKLASVKTTIVLKPGADGQEDVVMMEVDTANWDSAEKLRIKADFTAM